MELENYLQKIYLLLELQRYSHAHQLIQKALTAYPNEELLYLLRGNIFEQTENNKEVIYSYKKILALNPENWEAHQRLAYAYYKEGAKEESELHLSRCLNAEIENASVLAIGALIYADHHPFKADRMLKSAKKLDPTNQMVKSVEAQFNFMGLQFGKIQKQLVQNMQDTPNSASALFGMGLVLISKGQFTEAADLLRQSYVKEPDENKMDAWIDARLGKYFPFNFSLRPSWVTYSFPIGVQAFLFFVYLFFFFLFTFDKEPYYSSWIWIIHLIMASIFSLTYIIKYPIQYLFRRIYHPEFPKWTMRDLHKLGMLITNITYFIVIFNKELGILLGGFFILFNFLILPLVIKRTHPLTKTVFYSIYTIGWISFLGSNLMDLLQIKTPNLDSLPALLSWIIILWLDMEWAEKVERTE